MHEFMIYETVVEDYIMLFDGYTVKPVRYGHLRYGNLPQLNRAADLPYIMLILQKLWAVQWVWPFTAYAFILYSEI